MSQMLVQLEHALATYRTRMTDSNRAFWAGRIRALEQDSSLTERKRLDLLARHLGEGHWHYSDITRPSEILSPPGQPGHVHLAINNDGTIPPAAEATVGIFLDNLVRRINEIESEQPLEIPEEYRHLLKFTDAISDGDFRQSGDAQLKGTCGGVPTRDLLSDRSCVQSLWSSAGWTVLGGWVAGWGREGGHSLELLYCRKDGGSSEERQLAWRVYLTEGPHDLDGRWFPSIAAFLLYRADWFQRLPQGWENMAPDLASDASGESDSDEDHEAADSSDQEGAPDQGDDVEEDDDSDIDTSPYQAFDCIHDIAIGSKDPEPAGLDVSLAALSLTDRVSKAVRDFESKQQESNRKWLHARIKKIENTSDATEADESCERLARSFKFSSWSALASEHQLSKPRDLLSFDQDIGQLDSGTRPPVTPDARKNFLKQLTAGVNQVYDPNAANFHEVPLPEDYGILLSITDGLRDNDLRGSGVAGLDGVRDANISKMAPDETEKLPWANNLWRFGWELSTGFLLGAGKQRRDHWLAYYYCSRAEVTSNGKRKFKDPIKDNEKEWKWRLFYKEPQRMRQVFVFPMMFDGIVEWMQVYQGWWDREISLYPEWNAKNVADVKMMYPRKKKRVKLDPEQQGDQGGSDSIDEVDTSVLFGDQEE